jgi:tRNA 2-thiouridine synthesizing protein A
MDDQMLALASQQAEVCKVFGNVNRVMMLWILGSQEMSVGDIAEAIDTSLQNASQHLRLMKDKGILTSRREGHTIYYRIAGHELMEGCRLLRQVLQPMSSEVQNHNPRAHDEHNCQEDLPMTDIDLATVEAAKVVDARGSACPGPLLEAKKGIGAVAVGEVLEIWSGDANTKNDIPKWSKKVGHEYLGSLAADGYDRIFIKRSK